MFSSMNRKKNPPMFNLNGCILDAKNYNHSQNYLYKNQSQSNVESNFKFIDQLLSLIDDRASNMPNKINQTKQKVSF